MSRYSFELATEADDADLRRVLAETPMPGKIAVSFRREPSYFAAAAVDGRFRQVVAARNQQSGRIVGFGSRSISERYVNGQPTAIGYLGTLRLLEAHRNRGLIARGYAYFRHLHDDDRAKLYLTTIAAGNEVALRILTSGRAGLPRYHPFGDYHTVALPWTRRKPTPTPGIEVRPATVVDRPAIMKFLHQEGPRRQFFPCYEADDLFTPDGIFRVLRPADLQLAIRNGAIVGTLAAWDQHAFRQSVVHGYAAPLSWVRPAYNVWARIMGRPTLPGPGDSFRYRMAAMPVVADDDPVVFAALLNAVLALPAHDAEYLLIGLHSADPLFAVIRGFRATVYTTHMYLVCWDDGEAQRQSIDTRPPYLELGCL